MRKIEIVPAKNGGWLILVTDDAGLVETRGPVRGGGAVGEVVTRLISSTPVRRPAPVRRPDCTPMDPCNAHARGSLLPGCSRDARPYPSRTAAIAARVGPEYAEWRDRLAAAGFHSQADVYAACKAADVKTGRVLSPVVGAYNTKASGGEGIFIDARPGLLVVRVAGVFHPCTHSADATHVIRNVGDAGNRFPGSLENKDARSVSAVPLPPDKLVRSYLPKWLPLALGSTSPQHGSWIVRDWERVAVCSPETVGAVKFVAVSGEEMREIASYTSAVRSVLAVALHCATAVRTEPGTGEWKRTNGEIVRIADMNDGHLANALAEIQRLIDPPGRPLTEAWRNRPRRAEYIAKRTELVAEIARRSITYSNGSAK